MTSSRICWSAAAEGTIQAERRSREQRPISFAHELTISEGTQADWDRFKRWHYRGHDLAFTRRVVLLWHATNQSASASSRRRRHRSRARLRDFGLASPAHPWRSQRSTSNCGCCSAWCCIPPIAARGSRRRSCGGRASLSPVDWIETLSAMGHASPFFERRGSPEWESSAARSGPRTLAAWRSSRETTPASPPRPAPKATSATRCITCSITESTGLPSCAKSGGRSAAKAGMCLRPGGAVFRSTGRKPCALSSRYGLRIVPSSILGAAP